MPIFMVTASLPGSAARDVETKVTIPIEDEPDGGQPTESERAILGDEIFERNRERLKDQLPIALEPLCF